MNFESNADAHRSSQFWPASYMSSIIFPRLDGQRSGERTILTCEHPGNSSFGGKDHV